MLNDFQNFVSVGESILKLVNIWQSKWQEQCPAFIVDLHGTLYSVMIQGAE